MREAGNGKRPVIAGEMYIGHPGVDVVLTLADTWYQVAGTLKGIESEMTVDNAAGIFTIKHNDCYKFDGVASITPNLGVLIHFALFINANKQDKIETALDFQNNQDLNTFSGTGAIDLTAGDEVTVRAMASTAGKTRSVEHLNILLFKI